MTKSYTTHLINDVTYEERSKLVIKIAKLTKLGIREFYIKDCLYYRNGTLSSYSKEWAFLQAFVNGGICYLNLHYDANIMKLEDIGYMLQKNNRRQLWA